MNIFPSNNEKLIFGIITAFLVGLSLGIFVTSKSINLDFIVTSVVTLLAAYVGAKFAFDLHLRRQEKERITDEVKHGNKALFELIRTYNTFISVRNQFIDPLRDNPLRHFLIPPIAGLNNKEQLFDFNALTFLFNTDKPDILNSLSSFEQEVNTTIEIINRRSAHHYEVIQPAIERAENEHNSNPSEEQARQSIGKRNENVIQISTDLIVNSVDVIIKLSEQYISELNELLKKEYTEHRIVKMEISNKSKKPN